MSIEGKHSYRFGYLKSEHWQNVRIEALAREKARCQICGEESISNDAHHIWYAENAYDTRESQLVILCRPCHDFIHIMLPECKTNDEDEGYGHWIRFSSAIAAWRRNHANIFLPKQSPKELRIELERLRDELSDLKKAGLVPNAGQFTQKDLNKSAVESIVNIVRQWGRAFSNPADSVILEIANPDYQI